MDKNQTIYPEISKERFSRNLVTLLKRRQLTNEDVRRMVSVGTVQAVYKWTEGKSIPDLGTLCALAKILDVSVEFLVEPVFRIEGDNTGPDLLNANRVRFICKPRPADVKEQPILWFLW